MIGINDDTKENIRKRDNKITGNDDTEKNYYNWMKQNNETNCIINENEWKDKAGNEKVTR